MKLAAVSKVAACAVAASLVLNMVLHLLVFPLRIPGDFAPSPVMERGLLPPLAGGGMLVVLGALAAVFLLVEPGMRGRGWIKGFRFGAVFAGLWLIGFVEVAALSDTTVAIEVLNGAPDCLSIMSLSVLLGLFASSPATADGMVPSSGSASGGAAGRSWMVRSAAVALAFLAGRLFSYGVLRMNAVFHPEPAAVAAWTVAMAACVGLLRWVLRDRTGRTRPPAAGPAEALRFGLAVYGVDWFLFNLFLPLFIAVPLGGMVLRAGVDVAAVTLGALAAERLVPARPAGGA